MLGGTNTHFFFDVMNMKSKFMNARKWKGLDDVRTDERSLGWTKGKWKKIEKGRLKGFNCSGQKFMDKEFSAFSGEQKFSFSNFSR